MLALGVHHAVMHTNPQGKHGKALFEVLALFAVLNISICLNHGEDEADSKEKDGVELMPRRRPG